METKINNQEAYVSTMYLNIEFEIDGIEYLAHARYFNGDGIEDIEITYLWDGDNHDEGEPAPDEIYEIGKQLLFDMEIEEHITF